jgi:hypothetical protein
MLIVNACSMRQSLRKQCEPNKSQLESLPQATFTSLPASADSPHNLEREVITQALHAMPKRSGACVATSDGTY